MLAIGALLFFVSGFAALQYQVVWQRLLGIFSGADIQSATIIVAAFMAGLGCGSLTGGYLSDRLSRRGNLLMFAFAELAVGVFGFFSAALYYDVLYVRFGYLAANSAAMPAAHQKRPGSDPGPRASLSVVEPVKVLTVRKDCSPVRSRRNPRERDSCRRNAWAGTGSSWRCHWP